MSSNNNDGFPTYDFVIVWGIFAAVFIVVPFLPATIKAIFDRIALWLGYEVPTNQQEEQLDSDGRPIYSEWDVEYSRLSDRAKNQINTIRAEEISKRLDAFSTELKADHLVYRKPSQQFGNNDDIDESDDTQEKPYTSNENKCIREGDDEGAPNEEEQTSLHEIEQGGYDEENQLLEISSDDDTDERTEASPEPSFSTEANNFTHLCLPIAGYDQNGLRKLKKKSPIDTKTDTKQRKGLALFRHGQKVDANERAKEILSALDDVVAVDQDDVEQNNEKRQVPKFCAICLDEYELSDKVCWSSNPECTHVFHHDCMVQWQMTLGKRACKHQRFSEEPSVAQVLNFATECPCCRQSFIDKAVDVEVDGGNDSNV